jgi:superoxide dismutase, Cu-Zn family
MRITTTTALALAAMTLAVSGCGESADTPGEAVTDRTATERTSPEQPMPAAGAEQRDPTATQAPQPQPGAKRVETPVIDANGNEIGTLTIETQQQGLRLAMQVEGLTPGPHAVHFHQHGRCDPPEFKSAGDHYNPAGASHGRPDMDEDPRDQDHHVGDMENQDVDDQGTLNTVLVNHTATLDDGPATLLDEDGSALIIHADPDDYESQPSGNAGARVACAVVGTAQTTGT